MAVSLVPGAVELLMLMSMMGPFGVPLGVPPLPEDRVLASVAPEDCLLYASWAGIAEADPASPNHTEQLLAEPEVLELIDEIERLITLGIGEAARNQGDGQAGAVARDALRWGKRLLSRPAAFFVSDLEIGSGVPKFQAAALFNVGEDVDDLKATLERYQRTMLPGAAEKVESGEDGWYRLTLAPQAPAVFWGVKDEYLAIGMGDGVIEGLFERAEAAPPAWLEQIGRQLPVERRSTVAYLNVKAIRDAVLPLVPEPSVARVVEATGLDQVTTFVAVTGLDAEGFVSKSLVGLEGKPRGLFRLAAAEPLAAADLDAIPRDATLAVAARVDLEKVFDTILTIAGNIDPKGPTELLREIGEVEEQLGITLRRDVFGSLGDTWCIYNSPGEGGLLFTGLTAVVEIKDRRRLESVHARFLSALRNEMSRQSGRRSPRFDQFRFAGRDVYVFNARDDDFPLAPSWCLTDDALVVAPFPQNVKAYLARDRTPPSLADAPEVAALFGPGGGPVVLAYLDTKAVFDLLYPFAPIVAQAGFSELARQGIDVSVSILPSARAIGPHLRPSVGAVRLTEAGIEVVGRQTLPGGNVGLSVPMSVALLLPAVRSSREAARRAASMNNMKQIGLALHNYHDTFGSFPPGYTTDAEGKPLLSWRVHILPFVEQTPLYDQFRLDEPWDSEHNKRLIPLMPPVYRAPSSKADPTKTNYLGVADERGIFPGKEKIGLRDIVDGSSNTIMVVEVNDESAAIWTKPDDFVPDPDDPTRGLLGLRPGGFNAGMADGSVRFISETIDREILHRLFLRNDGQPVGDY